ncbi:hypothetical protein E1B28_013583 [Marasmius oreades]|uniref:Uncharacterized protein n=1 Tax=Marasmius oreades TaxID=181124 RepID=A0A9P7UN59_9AGAR|nr:uncharacterized protein E1B28_013583 [Marasmius oreades]KAG7087635.1 hypothetical protein E1B28_013583 [Marasmius oreades]
MSLLMGKPVIYLFSPLEREVRVRLGLAPQWSISALYPVVPINQTPGGKVHQTVEWIARTQQDGTLTETSTGTEVAYLFWEAHTVPDAPRSPPPSPRVEEKPRHSERFIPNDTHITPQNSVLLSIEALPIYLDKTLKMLVLHTEARTSFITYWLPSFLKHKHIALRFLPQSSYEEAAPLDITPTPDVVTRIFMLFHGVSEDELKNAGNGWTEAVDRSSEGVVFWQTVVGVDIGKAADENLFRVLEWGGMEVSC